ncbi:MAG: FG-GAP repeat protein [Phycisphaerales bacterium]
MRFAMMMTIGVLVGSAHAQPSTAGPGGPGRVLTPQKISKTAAANADLGDQLFKLLPNDGAAGDWFGYSVAISGATAIVGAHMDDDNGTDSGSAYLFNTTTGLQIFKFLPNDGAVGDQFGLSVAISGAIAIVGAYFDDDNGTASGSAYLFDAEIAAGGRQIAKLLADDGAVGDRFGRSVAIDGVTAIVGAYLDNDNGTSSGSAYLFDISDPASPIQIAKLLPDDGAVQDYFGVSVAISGTTAIVGAYQNDDNGSNSGSAYLFDTTTGQQIAKLLPDDGAAADRFGWSVAISGATAIVGAFQHDDNGFHSGSAYLFDATTGRQVAKLLANDGATADRFGWSVAISGSTAIVAAVWDDDHGNGSGSAYLFDISDPANPVQIAKLLPDDGAACDQFGWSVAVSGDTAIVGAVWDDDHGGDSGSAYLFDAAAPGKCPWDLDGNGSVGAADLLRLLVSWGPCKGCPADFDGNGTVGASDLLALLVNWGPCP